MSSILSVTPISELSSTTTATATATSSREWSTMDMYVTKRNGTKDPISFDKILQRIKKIGRDIQLEQKGHVSISSFDSSSNLFENHSNTKGGHGQGTKDVPPINYTNLAMKVIDQLYDGIPTAEIDTLSADLCASLSSVHPHYGSLASRIVVSNHHKTTPNSFSKAMKKLYSNVDIHGKITPLLSLEFYQLVQQNAKTLDAMINYQRDYLIDYFGFKTLLKSYLMQVNKRVIERPQHMWMRVALALHGNDLERVKETYDLMSTKHFTHATPTLFNAGGVFPQLSSCFLMGISEDSIDGIYDALKETALISKWAGGIGIHISNIRASGSTIRKTNGTSNGIVPMLKVFNSTSRYVDQGGGKRNGSIAVYLEPWHADVEMFLQMKRNIGDEELKARDLFYALYVEDLFMNRVKDDLDWTLMCPDECPGLNNVYGEAFDTLYQKYESEHRGRKTIKARTLWYQILDSIMETGGPYIVSKTQVNQKSNQKNLGCIKSSNLCVEVNTYSDEHETGVCFTGDTLILTKQGYERIDECDGKEVFSLFQNDVDWKERGQFVQATLIHNGIKDVYQLECYGRKPIKATSEHLFAVIHEHTSYQWKRLIELTEHDVILCLQGTDIKVRGKVKSITFVGQETVYDLYVPHTHNFVAEGFIVHNCNLSSIALPSFLDDTIQTKPVFNFEKLHKVTRIITYNLNRVIDLNFYPIEKARRSNMRHRPIGIGVQGLADVFMMLRLPFESEEARILNRQIFETMYHAALQESCHLAKRDGAYETFPGSPASQGFLQFDLWGVQPSNERYNWNELKEEIKRYGLRNSYLLAPMPTASTASILGYTECFECITSNIYSRRTLSGEFLICNRHLIHDLLKLGLWSEKMKNRIIADDGSIQHIAEIPSELKALYKTVWEIKMKTVIDMAADRGMYICQSQSLNLWLQEPNYNNLTSMIFYAHSKRLKSLLYYLRRRAKASAQKFTIPVEVKQIQEDQEEEPCELCSA